MIAPIREDRFAASSARVRAAKRYVASKMLRPLPEQPAAPPVPVWAAWLMVGWIVSVGLVYGVRMLNLW